MSLLARILGTSPNFNGRDGNGYQPLPRVNCLTPMPPVKPPRAEGDPPAPCIFYGSTGAAEYLREPHGNRRYWPIGVQRPLGPHIEKRADGLAYIAFTPR